MSYKLLNLTLLAGLALSGVAQAALHDRGGGLVYDDVLDITWLADANYAKTSNYDADGRMTWANAVAWATNLSYYDSVRNVTWDDWRLPTMVDTGSLGCNNAFSGTDCGYNVQTYDAGTVYSEMAYMYYVNLGFRGRYNPDGSERTDWGIFGNGTYGGERDGLGPNGAIINLQSFTAYWSGLEYAPNTFNAWDFYAQDGNQEVSGKTATFYAWAVRDGDVAPIPEADTWAMLLVGLGLVGLVTRRRRG